jgi:hypothetical protein
VGTAIFGDKLRRIGEASSTHLCTAVQYAALLRPPNGLTAIAPTQHGF